jgi:sarcosine oxidase subunit gamma
MSDWTQNSALDAYRQEEQKACLERSGLCIRELPPSAKLLLQARSNHETIAQAVYPVFGFDLPATPNSSVTGNPAALWLGPRKWLIILDSPNGRELQQQLETALSGMPCLVSDLSDARTGIEVSGAQARTVLARVCALDLDSCSFGPGQCAQSLLARVPLLLHQLDQAPTYHLYVDRSLAAYAWEWLSDASDEFTSQSAVT